jgi:hypothetical protein
MTIRPRWLAIAAVAVALVAAVCLLRRPARLGPEERIRAMLDEAAHAAEQRKVKEVVAVLSDRFEGGGEGARAGRDEVRRLLAFELLRGEWVSVTVSSARVIVDGRKARANVDAVLSRATDRTRGLASLLPGEASVHRFHLDLDEEEPGSWRVVSGSWRQIGLEEALSGPEDPGW